MRYANIPATTESPHLSPKKERPEFRALKKDPMFGQRLDIEIHKEFVWMRAYAQRIVLLRFHFNPVVKEVFVKHITLEEELVIGFQRFESAEQRIGHARDFGKFFWGQFVQILVERITRIDAVLDTVESCEQQSCIRQIRIGRGVRCPEFGSLSFRAR
jgi:hypothetical protein